MKKTAVITYMRANPPTLGHSRIFKMMDDYSKNNNTDAIVFLSLTQDKKKNPLSWEDKVTFLDRILKEKYPHVRIDRSKAKNIFFAMRSLNNKYKNIIVLAGADRAEEYDRQLHKYNGHPNEYSFDNIEVIPLNRDPDESYESGLSATKVRQAVINNDFKSYRRAIDSFDEDLIKDMWNKLRKGLNIEEASLIEEAEEAPAEIDSNKKNEGDNNFLDRVKSLYAKAGLDFPEIVENTSVKYSPNFKMIENLFKPAPNLDYNKKNYFVLVVDHLAGTKTFVDYVYTLKKNILDSKFKNDYMYFIVSRVLNKEPDQPSLKRNEANIKISLISKISNPVYSKEARSENFVVFSEQLETLWKKIPEGKNIYVNVVGSIPPDEIQRWFDGWNQLYPDKKINGTTQGLSHELKSLNLNVKAKTVFRKESDADRQLKELAQEVKAGKKVSKEELDKKIEELQIDPRIISSYLSANLIKAILDGGLQAEENWEEVMDAMSIPPIFTLIQDIKGVGKEIKSSADLVVSKFNPNKIKKDELQDTIDNTENPEEGPIQTKNSEGENIPQNQTKSPEEKPINNQQSNENSQENEEQENEKSENI